MNPPETWGEKVQAYSETSLGRRERRPGPDDERATDTVEASLPKGWTLGRTPKLADTVHYQAFGTPGGEYGKACRAAIVTEVGQWVNLDSAAWEADGVKLRTLEQKWDPDALALFVMNPTGTFHNGAGQVGCQHVEPDDEQPIPRGGTWHWADHE